jgi:hypothetical protein
MDERCGPVLLLSVIVWVFHPFWRSPQAPAPCERAGLQPCRKYLNTTPSVRYTGSNVCARCHADIYREFSRTAMGQSMAVLDDASLPGPAASVKLHNKKLDRDYEIFRRGSDFYQSEWETAPDGSEAFRDTRQIAFAIGAGENGIGYLVEHGRYLLEAPLSYYTQTRSWGLSPGYEDVDYGFDRLVPPSCLVCHSGRPQPVPGRDGLYESPPFEQLAIGCENCHGPGQLHVEERMSGAPLHDRIDRSIVNPADLPGWLADNVCVMCHEDGDARVLEPGKTYLDFRPGAPLAQTVAIFAIPFTRQSPPKSPLLQQYVQMVLSKCYRASGGKLSCITCHDPHVEPTAAEAPTYYRKKCLACHAEQSCGLGLAARLQKSPADDCAGCHMPRQNLQTISHAALTNHRIIAYAGEPFPDAAFHMTTANLPGLVYIDRMPGNKGPRLNPIVLLQAYDGLLQIRPEYKAYQSKLLDALAKTQPHNPVVLSALGQRAVLAGTAEGFAEAQADLGRAIAAGSTAASDLDLYAVVLIRAGSIGEAIPVLERDIALHPYSNERYETLAFAYIKLHEYRHALEILKQELQFFPQDSAVRSLLARVQSSLASSPN